MTKPTDDPGVPFAALDLLAEERAALVEFVRSWRIAPVLVAGAGLSAYNSEPLRADARPFGDWKALLTDFEDALRAGVASTPLPNDPLRLAQVFETQFGRATLLHRVAHHVPSDQYRPGPSHRVIARLPWSAVITPNYDDLIERAFMAADRSVASVVTDLDLTQPRTGAQVLVVKMHGDLRHRDSIVLTEEDYRRYETTRPGISLKVKQLLLEHPLLFVGFSMNDPNMVRIDGWIRDVLGSLRLPAIAVRHGGVLPAERAMWAHRGIQLVDLHGQPLLTLLESLDDLHRTWSGKTSVNAVRSRRTADIDRLVQEGSPQSLRRAATEIATEIARADHLSDPPGEAIRIATNFCSGWFFDMREPFDQAALVASFAFADLRRVLFFAARFSQNFAPRSGEVLDIIDGLLAFAAPTADEQARLYLQRGVHLRDVGAFERARQAFESATSRATSRPLRKQIQVEVRELLFLMSDRQGLLNALAQPDDGVDEYSICRRASDYLLLGQIDDAKTLYREATNAESDDVRFVALHGMLACADWRGSDPEFDALHREAKELRSADVRLPRRSGMASTMPLGSSSKGIRSPRFSDSSESWTRHVESDGRTRPGVTWRWILSARRTPQPISPLPTTFVTVSRSCMGSRF